MKATSLIVVGTPFSGAALLGHALGAHSRAFFAGELWRKWDGEADPGARECRACGGACATWSDPFVTAAVANGPAAVSAALAATTGRRLVIEGPALASWLTARLAYGEPSGEDARIVVCVCDPLLYVRKRAGVTAEVAKQRVAEWRDEQNALVRAALSSGRPLLVARYEDLANRLEETLARVCRFAGLEYEPSLSDWWEAPTHAIGAKSEAWGIAAPAHADGTQAAPADPRQCRVETLPALDRDPGASLDADVAHEVIAELRPTGLYETFGYEPELPPHRAFRDDAGRRKTAEWVKDDLRRAREAVLDDRANDAIGTLRTLVDHFGPAFDDLGLEPKYADVAVVLVDLLNNQQRGAEALPYARALAGQAPHNPEAQRLLAVAGASMPAAFEGSGRPLQSSRSAHAAPGLPSRGAADTRVGVHANEPAVSAFLDARAGHARLTAALKASASSSRADGGRALHPGPATLVSPCAVCEPDPTVHDGRNAHPSRGPSGKGPSAQEARDFIRESTFLWHQRFELAPQVFTPGVHDIAGLLHEADLPARMDGMTVLDIGTTNGAMAFECERRGAARIVAVDIMGPERFGLAPLIAFLKSKVEYVQASVYELADVLDDQFDLVIFWGVIYHLRHPLLGLDSVRRLSRGRMSLESAVCDCTDGDVGPLARFHRFDDLGADSTNWWSPSIEALQAWVGSAGFAIRKTTSFPPGQPATRALLDLVVEGDRPEYLKVSYERPIRLQTIDLS